jgi:hypothetical protein
VSLAVLGTGSTASSWQRRQKNYTASLRVDYLQFRDFGRQGASVCGFEKRQPCCGIRCKRFAMVTSEIVTNL